MHDVTPTLVPIFIALAVWVAVSVFISLIASGRVGRATFWTRPEHRLLAAGACLVMAGLAAVTFIRWEVDKFIDLEKWSYRTVLLDLKKLGPLDEVDHEIRKEYSDKAVERWAALRDLFTNFILLVAGGVGGGLITQGLIEKHQRRLSATARCDMTEQ